MPDQGSQRSTGDEQRARNEEEEAENFRAGVAEEAAEDEVERLAGGAPLRLAEDRHDAEAEERRAPCGKA